MAQITIDDEKCEGADCAECVEACPTAILTVKVDKIIIQYVEECNLCEICMDICPNEAIEVNEE
ncbi:MAG: 4Fe-4S dicluster domain-containing protein [Euryarchaeota archaeon]|nr:4Fe-4S dicluster domain-containing protein [Euryarchaeota archaeon]